MEKGRPQQIEQTESVARWVNDNFERATRAIRVLKYRFWLTVSFFVV